MHKNDIEKRHALYSATTKEEAIRFIVTGEDKDGEFSPKYDNRHETLKQHGVYPTEGAARAARMSAVRKVNPYYGQTAIKAIELPNFEIGLPQGVHDRHDVFMSLTQEEQEEILYAATLCTGLPLKRIFAWLRVTPEQMEHIDHSVIASARAELDLRIARKMVGFALKNNTPTAMTATLYLTKVFLAWNEMGQGETSSDANPGAHIDQAKSLFDNLQVVETHRDMQGNTTREPTVLKLVRDDLAREDEAA